jgi:hypothetical protein
MLQIHGRLLQNDTVNSSELPSTAARSHPSQDAHSISIFEIKSKLGSRNPSRGQCLDLAVRKERGIYAASPWKKQIA